MIGRWPKLQWKTGIRANQLDDALAKKMKAAGCTVIGMGVESGDPEILKNVGKGIKIEHAVNATRIAKENGIKVNLYFIIGHPNETYEKANRTIDLMVKLNPDVAAIGLMVPYPGTQIYDLATSGGGGYKLLSSDWDDYNKQVGNALELESLSRKMMERLQVIGYFKLYLYNFRFRELFKVIYDNRMLALTMFKKIITPKAAA